ncbi:ribosomal protein S5 domain 2-like protein [Xylona heveae TC161]|uniref:Ribosomal protein S5 domain 2-like protein n=1 Tax=Xylona heveae (strain CBS 132557 / TC161) TaxID=1328760 RepID=A0A165I5P6_XYLHT|nr:ribosomal protein S5 domain 2-like protein [Xylona heveae TC161]KZF24423.1 ribosomal protein S5 domain 2-like protein [Xylona heveae TC161]
MPLDTSTYGLALLRLDGRRWNELRRIEAQISTQAAADGSSYLEMGNTKVICTVAGPTEGRRGAGAGGGSSVTTASGTEVKVEISVAGFSGVDRKKRARGDKRTAEMQTTIANAFASTLFTHLYPHSSIIITLQILSQDGALLAACINASTLALIDAGIPMADYTVACTAGSTSSYAANDESADPLLDLNGVEEQELPFLTVGTLGTTEKVSVLVMETRCQASRLESMLAVGVDGCKQVREILDAVVRSRGKKMLEDKIA